MFEEELLEKTAVCTEILQDARNELYLNMRFLDVALNSLSLQPTFEVSDYAVDGAVFYYEIPHLIEQYKIGNVMVNRAYLHSVFHCLFAHVFKEKREEKMLWDLACDIAVESVIDSLPVRCLRMPSRPYRRGVYNGLQEKIRVLTAEGIYKLLAENDMDPRMIARLVLEFHVDDHRYWKSDSEKKRNGMPNENRWQDIREKMETELSTFSKEAAEDSKGLCEQLAVENREQYDYRSFLKKFCVLKEEMQVDIDSFDYIFYHYGMEMYGNMPLIEPLESREVTKISEFVIVIDTSYSTNGPLVQKFLEETFQIIQERDSFFHKSQIRIIQCDNQVHSDTIIKEQRDIPKLLHNFELIGGGGTDFRPAFSYINKLLEDGEFQNLKGVLYFTDGKGIYPAKRPPYETAFLFLGEEKHPDVPAWAMKLILHEEDL